MDVLVVCPNCKVGYHIPFDSKNDRPKTGFMCPQCQTKVT